MQHHNIRNTDFFNKQNLSELTSSISSAIQNSGITIYYYIYDKNYSEFTLHFAINGYIENSNNIYLNNVQASKVFDIYILTTDFLLSSNGAVPTKNDKVLIKDEQYIIVDDVQFYNTVNKQVESIDNSLLIKITVAKKDNLKRFNL